MYNSVALSTSAIFTTVITNYSQNLFITLKRNPILTKQSFPTLRPQPLATADSRPASEDLPGVDVSANGITHHVALCVRLPSLGITFLRLIHGAACVGDSSLFMAE